MAKKRTKTPKGKQPKQESKPNLYISTTIFAIIGTILYSVIIYLIYPSFFNIKNVIIFLIVIWVIYYFLTKSRYKRYYK